MENQPKEIEVVTNAMIHSQGDSTYLICDRAKITLPANTKVEPLPPTSHEIITIARLG